MVLFVAKEGLKMDNEQASSKAGKQLSKLGAVKGGNARAKALSPQQRSDIAKRAVEARWGKKNTDGAIVDEGGANIPEAKHRGFLNLMDLQIPCYVLNNGTRVIGRTSATEALTGIPGGGALEKYLGVAPLKSFIDIEKVLERFVDFRLPEVEGLKKRVAGLPADLMIDICRGMVSALEVSNRAVDGDGTPRLTQRQADIAIRGGMFLAACAKVGLEALIDEATGFQYERSEDALQVKLRAYLEEEMRKWERTFPDELWQQFSRLTPWKHSITKRPRYWGKLVMELVYEYLDADVAQWLRENAPKPRYGQNYHQWLSSQYGLQKLVEHIWKLIGVASTCNDIGELKRKMGEMYGRIPVQYTIFLPALQQNVAERQPRKRKAANIEVVDPQLDLKEE
jgi:P63C domain